ncbi:MAG TPA: S-layer homology domain-containing protein, partial [Bacilli bacterium]
TNMLYRADYAVGSNQLQIPRDGLTYGENTLKISVLSTGGNYKVYTLKVNLLRSADKSLQTLKVLDKTGATELFGGAFTPGTLDYSPVVDAAKDNVLIRAIPNQADAMLKINGKVWDSGKDYPIYLLPGMNDVAIEVTAQDGMARQTYTLHIRRKDAAAPVLALPADMRVEAETSSGTAVTYTVKAQDATDGMRTVICSKASGSVFALGTTVVACTATDLDGNQAAGSFQVTVTDTTPPLLVGIADKNAEAVSAAGAPVAFAVTATDAADASPDLTCTRSSGAIFPLGDSTVTCLAKDDSGNVSFKSFNVNVIDSTAPVWAAGSRIVATDITDHSMRVSWPAASDAVGVTGYRVYVNGQLAETVSGKLDCDLNQLEPDTDYSIKVVAFDAADLSSVELIETFHTAAANIETYEIAKLTAQIFAELTEGYEAGSQELKSITLTKTGTADLVNLAVTASGANADSFIVSQPPATALTDAAPAATFTIKARDGLPAGTYTATVTVSADQMEDVSFVITQVVRPRLAPAAPTGLAAVAGDGHATLTWDAVAGAISYRIYQSTTPADYGDAIATVTEAVYGYDAVGLVNGTTYYFVVTAVNDGGESAHSKEAKATPSTVPAAPTQVTAVAGDGSAVISFIAPADNGGSAITGYEVVSVPGQLTATGSGTTITVTGLSNGTTYVFTVRAINANGRGAESLPSNAVKPVSQVDDNQPPADDEDSPADDGQSADDEDSSADDEQPADGGQTADDGQHENDSLPVGNQPPAGNEQDQDNGQTNNLGVSKTTERNGRTETIISVDPHKLAELLESANYNGKVTISTDRDSDVVKSELSGQMIESMEEKQAVLEIKTNSAIYKLPANQLQLADLAAQFGDTALHDLKVQIEIAKPPAKSVKVVEDAAKSGNYTIVVPPLDFNITCTNGEKTVAISTFTAFVERAIAIPDGVDPDKITTGVVVEPDGTTRPVPTRIELIDGKYYAVMSSLTNSTYALVWHPAAFKDVVGHWAEKPILDMGSRMIVNGLGNGLFAPDRQITRAEFAAMIVRALGLKPIDSASPFADVSASAWYADDIATAHAYGIVSGYSAEQFGPNDSLTREQAMVMIAKAMRMTGLANRFSTGHASDIVAKFGDAAHVAEYAKADVALCVESGIVSGKAGALLAPKDAITRAEVAVIFQKLLQKSKLI